MAICHQKHRGQEAEQVKEREGESEKQTEEDDQTLTLSGSQGGEHEVQ